MQLLVELFIPILLILMMFVVGLELALKDFYRVRQFPVLVIIGSIGQLLFLPIIGLGIAWFFELSATNTAGLILISACPGGAISNFYVYMARANVALSITLTAISTLLSFISLPLISYAGFWLLMAGSERLEVPVVLMIGQLFALLLLPIAMGMWLRYVAPDVVIKQSKLLRRFSIMALALIIFFIVWEQADSLLMHLKELIVSATLYTLLTMAVGWLVGVALNADTSDKFTMMVEFSVRNLAIVTVVGATLFGNTELVVFAAAFYLIQLPFMLIAAFISRRRCAAL